MKSPPPLTVFIIPDNNRTYARKRGISIAEGYMTGYERIKEIVDGAWDFGVTHLVIWALGKQNLRRPRQELEDLFQLLGRGIRELRASEAFRTRDIRFRAVGEWHRVLPRDLAREISRLEEDTKSRSSLVLTLAIAYNGRDDMAHAMAAILEKEKPSVSNDRIRELIPLYLQSSFVPDIDLMIRTGGEEPHLSEGAFMWQMSAAHTEFPQKCWPEFTKKDLSLIISKFRKRERRFGK